MKKMISVAEAKGLIADSVLRLDVVEVKLMEGLGRCLAEDIFSPIDMPGFAQSAMDGYAFSSELDQDPDCSRTKRCRQHSPACDADHRHFQPEPTA